MKSIRIIFLAALLSASACTQHEKAAEAGTTASREEGLQQQVQQYPDSAILRENLLQYYRENGNYDRAFVVIGDAIKKDSLNPRWWDIKGTLHMEDNDTLQAIQSYQNAIRLYPDPQYVMALGVLYAQTGNAQALEMADALLVGSQAKAEKEAYFIKGLYYSNTGDKQKAITLFDRCLSISYTYMDAYVEKSICLYDLGKYNEALAVLDKAVTLQNNFEEGYYYRGRCLEKLHRLPEAVESYQQALAYDPGYIEARDALARLGIKN